MNRTLRSVILVIIGSLAVILAVFAAQLGLDRSPGWGSIRLMLLISGIVLYLAAAGLHFWRGGVRGSPSSADSAKATQIETAGTLRKALMQRGGLVVGILLTVGTSIYAVWYSSAGLFPKFPYVHNDYADLGDALLHGQLSLLEQPTAQLMALPNPYDFDERESVPFRWDASYYRGKYYLYWGPVPAVVSSFVEIVFGSPPSGAALVVLAYVGLIFTFFALLLSVLWQRFGAASAAVSGLMTAVAFINFPLLFQLGQARVYEASILYGQFFLLAGLLAWELYRQSSKVGWLTVAGLAWALAVGCRYNLLFSVLIFLAIASLWLWRKHQLRLRPIGFLVVPLLVGTLIGGIYNQLRFDNALETGKTYQLTVNPPPGYMYSSAFIPANLYIYLFYPVTTAAKFPFVKSALFDPQQVPAWIRIPPTMEFDHVLFGALTAVPFLWLLMLAVPLAWLQHRAKGPPQAASASGADVTLWMLAAAAASQILYLAAFFYTAERYVGDGFLSLMLIAAVVLVRFDSAAKNQPLRLALWVAATGLAVWSIATGFFGAFSVPPKTFDAANPGLYAHLASYWNDRFATIQVILERLAQILHLLKGGA